MTAPESKATQCETFLSLSRPQLRRAGDKHKKLGKFFSKTETAPKKVKALLTFYGELFVLDRAGQA